MPVDRGDDGAVMVQHGDAALGAHGDGNRSPNEASRLRGTVGARPGWLSERGSSREEKNG
jgi:hypothetical protein